MLDVINAGSSQIQRQQNSFPDAFYQGNSISDSRPASLQDVRLCLEEAERLGVPMMVGTAVRQLVGIAKALEGPDSTLQKSSSRLNNGPALR
jgi:hypothetical protein